MLSAATSVVNSGADATAVPAMVGSAARPPFAASEPEDSPLSAAMGVGAAGDIESLQPTTVNARTAIETKPASFFMTLSLVSFAPSVLNHAAPRCIRLRMFCRRRLCGHCLNIY